MNLEQILKAGDLKEDVHLKITGKQGLNSSGAYSTFLLPAISFLSRLILSQYFFATSSIPKLSPSNGQDVCGAFYAPSGWPVHKYYCCVVNHLNADE